MSTDLGLRSPVIEWLSATAEPAVAAMARRDLLGHTHGAPAGSGGSNLDVVDWVAPAPTR